MNFHLQCDLRQATLNDSIQSIAPDEFCQLAVSTRPLVRWEDAAQGLKGLRDEETGESFVVCASELSMHHLSRA